MNKRVILWALTIVLLVVSLPGVFQRWQAEEQSRTYELAVPYEEIYDLTMEGTVLLDEALGALSDAGVDTISFSPVTLEEWEEQGILSIYNQRELQDAFRFSGQPLDFNQDKKGFYVTVPEDPSHVQKINDHFTPDEVSFNGVPMYFIPMENKEDKHHKSNIGYDEKAIETIKEYGFRYILRFENDKSPEMNQQAVEELLKFKDDPQLSTLLFEGTEVIGFPDPEAIKQSAWQLYDAGYHFYTIDMNDTKGEQTFARAMNYETIRLFSVKVHEPEALEKVIRSVKERNIRSIFFHPAPGDPIESLETAVQFVKDIQDGMPDQFVKGEPVPFADIQVPIWSQLAGLLAGVLFTYLAVSGVLFKRLINMPEHRNDNGFSPSNKRLNNDPSAKPLLPKWLLNKRLIEMLAVLGMLALIGGYFVLDRLLFLQAFGLAIAIITPIYAVLANAEGTTKIGGILWQYIRATAISFIGIIIIIAVMNGNGFVAGFEEFRGVKLVYGVPLVGVALFILFAGQRMAFGSILDALKSPVRYLELILIALVVGISYYYIMRTGNAGAVSDIELAARQWLEDMLHVRPRTKEFLIGFPFYILAIYVIGFFKAKMGKDAKFSSTYRWSYLLLIPATIGFLSIVNTFTHFHIPINMSLLRTAYGLGFGFVVGLILIGLFIIGYRLIANAYKKRWS